MRGYLDSHLKKRRWAREGAQVATWAMPHRSAPPRRPTGPRDGAIFFQETWGLLANNWSDDQRLSPTLSRGRKWPCCPPQGPVTGAGSKELAAIFASVYAAANTSSIAW